MEADETSGFPAFFRAHYAEVAASLSMALTSRELGDEAASEAFARAYARWSTVRGFESPVGWTYRVGLNHGLRTAKRRGHEAALLRRTADPSPSTEDSTDVHFWSLLRSLPERQRIAAALRYGADLTEAEIARIMRVRRSTVSSALEAARLKLEPLLAPATADDDTRDAVPEPSDRSHT